MIFTEEGGIVLSKECTWKLKDVVILNDTKYIVRNIQKRNVFYILRKYAKKFCPHNHTQISKQMFFDKLESEFGQIRDLGYNLYVVNIEMENITKEASASYVFYHMSNIPTQNKHQISGIIDDILDYYMNYTDTFTANKLEGFESDNLIIRLLVKMNDFIEEINDKIKKLCGDFGISLKIEKVSNEKGKECLVDFQSIKKSSFDPYFKWKARLPQILSYLETHNHDVYFSDICRDLNINYTIMKRYMTFVPLIDTHILVKVGNVIKIQKKEEGKL